MTRKKDDLIKCLKWLNSVDFCWWHCLNKWLQRLLKRNAIHCCHKSAIKIKINYSSFLFCSIHSDFFSLMPLSLTSGHTLSLLLLFSIPRDFLQGNALKYTSISFNLRNNRNKKGKLMWVWLDGGFEKHQMNSS